MTKVRKQKRKQKFQYNVNRKRLNKKRLPASLSSDSKNEWKTFRATKKNFESFGLLYDVNKGINDPVTHTSDCKENTPQQIVNTGVKKRKKSNICNMSKNQMEYLSYFINKYGDDYRAMVKDKKNHLQQTWKQLRTKIQKYQTILEKINGKQENSKDS